MAGTVGVPAVGADQYAQAPCGGVDDLQCRARGGGGEAGFIRDRECLALGLTQGRAIRAEDQADVVQRALAGPQDAVHDLWLG